MSEIDYFEYIGWDDYIERNTVKCHLLEGDDKMCDKTFYSWDDIIKHIIESHSVYDMASGLAGYFYEEARGWR